MVEEWGDDVIGRSRCFGLRRRFFSDGVGLYFVEVVKERGSG